jgi:hypothetical protein
MNYGNSITEDTLKENKLFDCDLYHGKNCKLSVTLNTIK